MPLASLKPAVTIDMLAGDVLVLLSDGIYEAQNGRGEEFGETRVQELVQAHHEKPMARWLALLFESVKAFAGGTTQEDDMTAVVVKREA
jgi:sigma-B regulation protein RsbU (phosphoserine phosphatase)